MAQESESSHSDLEEPTPTRGPATFTLRQKVPMRFYSAGRGNTKKETSGLATCIRVAVAGDYLNPGVPGYDRFLAHVDDLEEPVLQGFMALLTAAHRAGLSNLRAIMVVPTPESDVDNSDDTNDDQLRQNQIRQMIATVVDPDRIEVVLHDSEESWYLAVEANKAFTCWEEA